MYRFLSSEDADMTRFVTLKNTETGTVEECFDDSDVVPVGVKDFSFMEQGKEYDCKITLFGDIHPGPAGERVLCRVVREDVFCGQIQMVEIMVGEDVYYLPYYEVKGIMGSGVFYYYYTRKDLIQVDDVIHGDYLNPPY